MLCVSMRLLKNTGTEIHVHLHVLNTVYFMFQTDSDEDVIFVSEKSASKSQEICIDEVLGFFNQISNIGLQKYLLTGCKAEL